MAGLPQKLSRANLQRLRQLIQRSKRKILFGPLYRAHIRSVEITPGGKLFLRPSPLFAKLSHISRDDLDGFGLRHVCQRLVLMPIALQCIPSIRR
jgi:hypothetical protein